jgi:hypothetical protein
MTRGPGESLHRGLLLVLVLVPGVPNGLVAELAFADEPAHLAGHEEIGIRLMMLGRDGGRAERARNDAARFRALVDAVALACLVDLS